MRLYRDYLSISQDFIPVFSKSEDRGDNWKGFIPHAQMRDALTLITRALERGRSEDKLSLWMMGAYGTGKTYASFVIKHLLEDDPGQVEPYFQKYDILAPLWPRFRSVRSKGSYVVAHRSGSGEILSNRRLMIEVQRSIEDALRARGLKTPITQGIMEQMVSRLTDSSQYLNWEGMFAKYRGRFPTVNSAEEAIERLKNHDVRVAEQIASVFDDLSYPLLDSADDVKTWIKSALEVNNLPGIVLIWDEFTEFFDSGLQLTPLEKLAEAVKEMPFYLFLITHKSLNQYGRLDDATRKWLQDRFHTFRLEMNPITAYRLISNVIEVNADRTDEWNTRRETLWSGVDRVALVINVLGESVRQEDLKQLLPMHPFSAYLLSTISSLYSSSQRTLFKFLKTNEKGSFQWFIDNYPKDNWFWLTADYLWQYFFEGTKVESMDSVADVLTYYNTHIPNLTLDEARVFRVMMLLTALQRQTHGATELLNPRLSVVKRMFLGTSLYREVDALVRSLCDRGLLLSVPTARDDFEYTIPTAITDPNKLRQYRQRLETSHSFEKMIDCQKPEAEFAREITGALMLQGAQKLRHPIRLVSAKELRNRRERVLASMLDSYQVGVLLVLAQDDDHIAGLEPITMSLSKGDSQQCILVSQSPFGSKRWEEWLDCRSKALYYADLKDETTAKYYDTKASGLFKEWFAELRAGRILAFYNGRLEEMSGCESVRGYLDELVHKVFPFGPEQISRTYTLYDSTWGKVGAEIGLEVSRTVQRPYKDVVDTLVAQGVWEKTGQKQRPGHPLCQMKRVVDKAFDGADCVNLKELWETLQQPPYGLMPSAIGILVFSALLRPYSQGYYYSDNVNSLPLNPNKLAELVERTLKGMKYSETYTIRRMSPQAERFCEIARSVFSLPPEQSKYPEEVRKQLRKRISDMGVPLWAAGYYQPQSLSLYSAEAVRKATGALRPLLLFGQDELTDEQMECISQALEPVRGELPRRLSRQSMESGMKQFIKEKAPRLLPLASALGLDLGTVLLRIRSLLNEETYLWQEERVEQKLPEVVNGLDLTDAINRICGTQSKDLESARVQFRASWFGGKFPLPLYAEGQPEDLADVIIYLDEIVYHPERGIVENRADDIRRLKDRLTYVLSDDLVVVKRLIHEITGEDAPIEDASSVHSSLPRLTDATRDGIRQAVLLALSAQTRQRKIADTRRLWKAITGSDTPEGWTAISKIPYQWVLEGRALDTAERLSKASTLTEAQLDELLDYLESRPEELLVLGDPEECLHRFVRVVAGDYAKLVYEAQGSSSLHEYIASNMEVTVSSWVLRLHEVNRVARRWVTENYHATAYPTIVRKVDSLPAEDTRSLLKELASDAIVGSRLLAAMEDQHKT